MNIIRKAKDSANKRSVDAYGRSVELAIASHLLDTGTFPTDLNSLTIEYTGKEVSCNIMQMKENGGIYLSECTVGRKQVKDDTTEDGWYHYGTRDLTNEEYVDMYGLALKNASVAYYEANGNPVEDYTNLAIDYKGKPVSCDVTVNHNGTIYLENCKVDDILVLNHTFGSIIYKTGDLITHNNVNYYVIEDEGENITLLKAEPITPNEILPYLSLTEVADKVNTTKYYIEMAYYSASSCVSGGSLVSCSTDYEISDIKQVVDVWKENYASDAITARLINQKDLIDNLAYTIDTSKKIYEKTSATPEWIYGSYTYWTMIPYKNSASTIWYIDSFGILCGDVFTYDKSRIYNNYGNVVRPVITIPKSALSA